MSNVEQLAEGQNFMAGTLRQRVEELAVKLMLGGVDSLEWTALLNDVCCKAKGAGCVDVARIAAESLDALSQETAVIDPEAVMSDAIARMQQVLTDAEPGMAPAGQSLSSSALVPAPLALSEDRELIGDFLLESREHLTQVEIQMLTLEKDPGDGEAINTVFRAFHTIKGLAGFM